MTFFRSLSTFFDVTNRNISAVSKLQQYALAKVVKILTPYTLIFPIFKQISNHANQLLLNLGIIHLNY